MQTDRPSEFVYPSVVSDLPEPEEYLPWIREASRNNHYSNFGPLCRQFAGELLAHFGLPGEACVPCSSATAGLSAALIASGAKGRVLIPAFTFPATLSAVRAAGLAPLVMDVDAERWAIGAAALDAALAASKCTAVILVAPFGMTCDFTAHIAACRRHNAVVVIDNAAGLSGQRLNPCLGEDVFEVFSLHATKPLGIGEGGVVFCDHGADANLRSALNFGLTSYMMRGTASWGFNGKLSEVHAAIGLAQLRRWKPMIEGRQRFAAECIRLCAGYATLQAPNDALLAPWQIYPVAMPTEAAADAFAAAARELGMEIRRYYRPSLSQWAEVDLLAPCPVAEDLASRMVALPVRSIPRSELATPMISIVRRALNAVIELGAGSCG